MGDADFADAKSAALGARKAGGPAGRSDLLSLWSRAGGSVQANVDRWFKQFSDGYTDAKTEEAGNTTITFVKAEGTFASGMPGGPIPPR